MDTRNLIRKTANERLIICDGAIGSNLMINSKGRELPDFSNENDPVALIELYSTYLDSGADILTTNTINANSLQFNKKEKSVNINTKGVEVIRQAIESHSDKTGLDMIAGSVGPTNLILGASEFGDRLYGVYLEQIRTLIKAGVDIIILETMISSGNIKTAIKAFQTCLTEQKAKIPLWLSLAPTGPGGRLQSGEKAVEVLKEISGIEVMIAGVNCISNFEMAEKVLYEFKSKADILTSFMPNAGIPDKNGNYPIECSEWVGRYERIINGRLVNIIGGCCGTTPEYIRSLTERYCERSPRSVKSN